MMFNLATVMTMAPVWVPCVRRFDANTQTTATSGLSGEMKTYYHDRLIDAAEPELYHDQFGDEYDIPAHGGKTIEMRKWSTLPKALTALTEGVTPSGRSLSMSTISATVAQYGDYVTMSDMIQTTAVDKVVLQATKQLGGQSGRTLDTITREVLCGGTNKMFAPSVSGSVETEILLRSSITDLCRLTPAVVRKAAGKLKRMNAKKIGDSYVCIAHPDALTDLMGDSAWEDAHKYCTPENMYKGEVGRLYGVRFVETTEAKIIGPKEIFTGVSRLHLKTALDTTGSVNITTEEAITADQATELTAAITAGTVKVYVGGTEATLASVTSGDPGTAKLVATAEVKSKAAGSMICGVGAGADGNAVYCTLFLGANAYGVTKVAGMGLEHIVKQLGSGDDPLNQRSTAGWKATKVAERLVEENMVRVEHGCKSFGLVAESN